MKAQNYSIQNFANGDDIIINNKSYKVIADLKSHWLIKTSTGQICFKKY